jgi:PAS domain S-box-containing protein
LFFVLATASVISIAVGELSMMRAESVEHFVRVVRWVQLPVFVLVVALVSFVHLYLGAGRLWLGISACAMRFACVIVNFVVKPSLSYREITGLRQLHFLGEDVSAATGVLSPRIYMAEFSSVLLFLFLVDASIGTWRRGTSDNRRRALVVGGSTAFFVLLAAGMAALTQHRIIEIPYIVSFPFAAILGAMAFELGSDLFRAGIVVQKLEASEASLFESEERFRITADAAPVLIWMSGLDKLCTFFNKAWLEFTGRTIAQELGNGWTEGVHADDFEKCVKTYANAFDAREPFVMQYRLKRHDGEYRWLTDNGVPRYDPNGKFVGYIGACVDITDLLNNERALHEFEQRVALAAEAAHLGVWELDTTTNELWMSDQARKLFQFDPKMPVSYATFCDRVLPEDRARRDQAVEKAMQTQGGYETEYRIMLPDGTVRWIAARARCVSDEGGEPARLLAVSMDVTERRQAQELFRLATEASPSGILVVNDRGRIVLVNAHAKELFGYEREELTGKSIEVLVPERFAAGHPAYRAKFMAAPMARAMGAGRELFARRKDGTEFPVEIGLNPITTPKGILVLASVVDISARKAAEEEARQRREQIGLLSRVSLLGEMTASLAHELNQPLTAIVSNANAGMRFIDRGKVDPATLREILVDVEADGRRANDIIRTVRSTIKKGGAIRQRINLNDAVMKVTHMIRPDATACSCEVQTFLAEKLPAVEGDPVQIEQVLINLISNAFDAMRDTPVINRKVEIVTDRNADETVCVSVRDRGAGIRDELRERLFEQFFTTKAEGLGMGLAIVRSIIEAHGGKIEAENVDGGGARFYFNLPTCKEI